jgi:hypothetical protein
MTRLRDPKKGELEENLHPIKPRVNGFVNRESAIHATELDRVDRTNPDSLVLLRYLDFTNLAILQAHLVIDYLEVISFAVDHWSGFLPTNHCVDEYDLLRP